MQLTLWRDLGLPITSAAPRVRRLTVVPVGDVDERALADLYLAAYAGSGLVDSVEDAHAEMVATLAGEYGALLRDASLAVVVGEKPVAVVQTVLRAPWPDVQSGPFVIEMFTAPDQRRQGLARHLLVKAIIAVAALEEQHIGLRVDSDNASALQLYRSLAFAERKP